MTTWKFRLRPLLAVLALSLLSPLLLQSGVAIAQTGGASVTVTPSKAQYQVGDSVQICYRVPGPGPVRLTDSQSGAAIVSGNDDGTGGCQNGTITPPTGQECFILTYQSSRGSGSTQACIQIASGQNTSNSAPPPAPPPPSSPSQPSNSGSSTPAARFYGTVRNATGATVQGTVVASVGGQQCGTGSSGSGGYSLDIQPVPPCDFAGSTVTFSVQGQSASSTGTIPATAGTAVLLNLTVQSTTSGNVGGGNSVPTASVSITTNQTSYQLGNSIAICYKVSGPGQVTITDSESGVLTSGHDDGTGGCVNGTATPPLGPDTESITFTADSGGSASAQTTFTVNGASSSGGNGNGGNSSPSTGTVTLNLQPGCNQVTSTFPNGTIGANIAATIQPSNAVYGIRVQGSGAGKSIFFSDPNAPTDALTANYQDSLIIQVSQAATLTEPPAQFNVSVSAVPCVVVFYGSVQTSSGSTVGGASITAAVGTTACGNGSSDNLGNYTVTVTCAGDAGFTVNFQVNGVVANNTGTIPTSPSGAAVHLDLTVPSSNSSAPPGGGSSGGPQACSLAPTLCLTLSPTSGPPGTTVQVNATGLPASAQLDLVMFLSGGNNPSTHLGSVTTTNTGTLNSTFTVPQATAPGGYFVRVVQSPAPSDPSQQVLLGDAGFTVTSTGGNSGGSSSSLTATANCTPQNPNVGDTVTCTATATSSLARVLTNADLAHETDDQVSSSFNWDFDDGITAVGQTVTHVYTESGAYSVSLVATDSSGRAANSSAQVNVKPGGVWIGPCANGVTGDLTGKHCPDPSGADVEGHIVFMAKAYPTHTATDPQIDHVNFTAQINGNSIVACKVKPDANDNASCDWWPGVSPQPLGQVTISFDVYDTSGNVNQAPNGEHTISFDSSGPSLLLPFSTGETWYVCQGYNGDKDHTAKLGMATALDLSTAQAAATYPPGGSKLCNPSTSTSSEGKTVRAPASGTISTSDPTWGESDFVCVNFDAGGSTAVGHLSGQPAGGTRVNAGDPIGTVNPPQLDANGNPNTDQGGYAHIHIQVFPTPNCAGAPPIPFDSASQAQFQGVGDLPDAGNANEWYGMALTNH